MKNWHLTFEESRLVFDIPLTQPAKSTQQAGVTVVVACDDQRATLEGNVVVEATVLRFTAHVASGKLVQLVEYDWLAAMDRLQADFDVEFLPYKQVEIIAQENSPQATLVVSSDSEIDELYSDYWRLLLLRGAHGLGGRAFFWEIVERLQSVCHVPSDFGWVATLLLNGGSVWGDLLVLEANADGELPLTKWWRLRHEFPPPDQNLGNFESFLAMVTMVENWGVTTVSETATPEDFARYSNAPYGTTLFDDPNLRVVQLLNITGSRWWSWLWRPRPKPGSTARLLPSWCTGWDDTRNWDHYTNQGPLYVVWDKTGVVGGKEDKWQIHLQSGQFKDRENLEVDRSTFVHESFMHAIATTMVAPDRSLLQAGTDLGFFHDGEDYLDVVQLAGMRNSSSEELRAHFEQFHTLKEKIMDDRDTKASYKRNTGAAERRVTFLPRSSYVTKFCVLSIAKKLPNDLVIWLWLLATGNRYSNILVPQLNVGSLLQHLKANVVMRHEATIMNDFATASALTKTETTLVKTIPLDYVLRLAQRLYPVTDSAYLTTQLPNHQTYALLTVLVAGNPTPLVLNSLWKHKYLGNVVLHMNKKQFDDFWKVINNVAGKKLLFEPNLLLNEIHSQLWPALVDRYRDHNTHYLLWCLFPGRTPNLSAFVSKVGSLSAVDYEWLLTTWVETMGCNVISMTTLARMVLARPIPNVVEFCNKLASKSSDRLSPIASMLECYKDCMEQAVPVLANLLAVVDNDRTTHSVLRGGNSCNFYNEFALEFGMAAGDGWRVGETSHDVKISQLWQQVQAKLETAPQLEPDLANRYALARLTHQRNFVPAVRRRQDAVIASQPIDTQQMFAVLSGGSFWDKTDPVFFNNDRRTPINFGQLGNFFRPRFTPLQQAYLSRVGGSSLLWGLRWFDHVTDCYRNFFRGQTSFTLPLTLFGTTYKVVFSEQNTTALLLLCCSYNDTLRHFLKIAKMAQEPAGWGSNIYTITAYLHRNVMPKVLVCGFYLFFANQFVKIFGNSVLLDQFVVRSTINHRALVAAKPHAAEFRRKLNIGYFNDFLRAVDATDERREQFHQLLTLVWYLGGSPTDDDFFGKLYILQLKPHWRLAATESQLLPLLVERAELLETPP